MNLKKKSWMHLSCLLYVPHVPPISFFLIWSACVIFRNNVIFFRWGAVNASPNPQAGGSPLVGCPRLLIQYICSYLPYPGTVPPFVTWVGRGMPWWQRSVYHELQFTSFQKVYLCSGAKVMEKSALFFFSCYSSQSYFSTTFLTHSSFLSITVRNLRRLMFL